MAVIQISWKVDRLHGDRSRASIEADGIDVKGALDPADPGGQRESQRAMRALNANRRNEISMGDMASREAPLTSLVTP
jgi:hypothetical protein